MQKNQIFEVDLEGLRQLQEGKPKWIIIRELLQNAIDEEINECIVSMEYKRGKLLLTVEDDSPTGFQDLADIYTLFKDTYKRSDITKRGRFNFGEKQVLCLADHAEIVTTTGGFQFDMIKGIKTPLKLRRQKGSSVYIEAKMTKDEYLSCKEYCNQILVPPGTNFYLNETNEPMLQFSYQVPYMSFPANLPTEIKIESKMRKVTQATLINLHKPEGYAYIYEMGIPICEIDCDYSIDVQQKVPLSPDRDTVDAKYLKLLYGEVLNHTIKEIKSEQSSNLWVREGFVSPRASKEVKKEVLEKRFGEKSLIANPMDKRSMDEAITNNYNVVYGSEMSKEEWGVIREEELMESTSSKFKVHLVNGTLVEGTLLQQRVGTFCVKIAKEFLSMAPLKVSFYEAPEATVMADFDRDAFHLRFNLSKIPSTYWQICNGKIDNWKLLDLIIHELGHHRGMHYEQSYHECITMLGSRLAMRALRDPAWFTIYEVAG